MSQIVIINNARLSFDKNLFEPNKKDKRTCNLITSDETTYFLLADGKKTPIKGEAGLIAIIEGELKAKFNGKVPPKYENWAIRRNSDANSAESGERYKGYEDDKGIYFSPSRFAKQGYPAFVRPSNQPIDLTSANGLDEAQNLFYGGCYVNAKLNLAAFETKEDGVTKRGVTTFLEALQFVRDGERFGGGSATAEGFDAVEQAEEEDNDL